MTKKKSTALQIYNIEDQLLMLLDNSSDSSINLSSDVIMQLAEFTGNTGWLGWGLPQISRSSRGTLLLELATCLLGKVQSGEITLNNKQSPITDVTNNTVHNNSTEVTANTTEIKMSSTTVKEKPISVAGNSTSINQNEQNEHITNMLTKSDEIIEEKRQKNAYPIQTHHASASKPENLNVERKVNDAIKNAALNAFN